MTSTILTGDALEMLKTIESGTVNTCVTSPPYYGLRDYGVDGQIGLEEMPEQYISKLVEVFREVRRVLRDDGTCWVNIGDSYCNTNGYARAQPEFQRQGRNDAPANDRDLTQLHKAGFKTKDLIGIPWMLAFALRADGWYLRQDIIWSKPNPMPESVRDRCTKSHEYIFLLSKSKQYYYDADAIKEPIKENTLERYKTGWNGNQDRGYVNGPQNHMSEYMGMDEEKIAQLREEGRNKRSVWTVCVNGFKEAHFATFPQALIEPCILAGAPFDGLVLDPFTGSGTTAVTALQNGRNFIGVELNPKYVTMAEKRIKKQGHYQERIELEG
jgi:DNA modification methylase